MEGTGFELTDAFRLTITCVCVCVHIALHFQLFQTKCSTLTREEVNENYNIVRSYTFTYEKVIIRTGILVGKLIFYV